MAFQSPPPALVDASGNVAFGTFDAPIPDVNLDRARVAGVPAPFAWSRLKQWQHWCVVHPEMALTFAVVDAAFLRVTWVQYVDRKGGEYFEHARQGPFLPLRVSRSLWDERCGVQDPEISIDIHNHLSQGIHRIGIAAGQGEGRILASLECPHDLGAIQPLVVSLPVGRGRAMYSHKVALPVRGEISVGEKKYTLDEASCEAILDEHKAHYPRRTWWNWATFAGRDAQGRRVALNLTRNVVVGDDLNENALWIDGRLHALGKARFSIGAEAWEVGTEDGAADLVFHPEGERVEDVDYGLVVSKFRQPFGLFEGRIRVDGETVEVKDVFGVAEDHRSVW